MSSPAVEVNIQILREQSEIGIFNKYFIYVLNFIGYNVCKIYE